MNTEKIIKEEILKAFRYESTEEHLALIINMNRKLMDGVVHECQDMPIDDEDLFRSIIQCCFQLSKHGLTIEIKPL